MKRTVLAIVLSAVLGSATTVGILELIEKDKTVKVEYVSTTPVKNISMRASAVGKAAPMDFTAVAEKVTSSVVHIKSESTLSGPQRTFEYRQLPDPFRDFFNDDMLDNFFGPRFWHQRPEGTDGSMLRIGTGSGVIITEDGYVVTNNHVIDQADDIEITLRDKCSLIKETSI